VGATGKTGAQGPTVTGAAGYRGAPGKTGAAGPAGGKAVGLPGAKGPKGATGPMGTPKPDQLPQGATGATGYGEPGATGPTGNHGNPSTCFEVYVDSVSNFDALLNSANLESGALGQASTQDTQASCPADTTCVGGGRTCLPGGWKNSYGFPFGTHLDASNGSYLDVSGWQGNCGAGPVRVYAICCPIGTVNVPSYGQYL
jgi:hypothetical protein